MNTTMADGAEQRLDAQIAEALFGQPGMSKMDVANRVRELRGDGPALLVGGSHGSEMQVADGPWPEIDAILADAYSAGAEGLPFGGIARRAAVRAAVATLSAQPSPGGRADALTVRRFIAERARNPEHRQDVLDGCYDSTDWFGHVQAALAAPQPVRIYGCCAQPEGELHTAECPNMRHLAARQPEGATVKDSLTVAARQPVGKPVAWLVHWSDMPLESPEVTRSASRISEVSALTNPPRIVPLYAAPPAQADQEYLESLDRALEGVIDRRDRYHETADDLAGHIASITGVDIGEHSSANCPWQNAIEAAEKYQPAQAVDLEQTFQAGVSDWMDKCFLPSLYSNMTERGDRLLEEVLELLQAHGYDKARVPTLVDYVFSRPAGDPAQEVGGVMVTLAGYCWVAGLDMHVHGHAELARINHPEVMAKIRAKQEAKNALHFDTPLPGDAGATVGEWPREGDLVRYGDGCSALAIRLGPHAGGWHGYQCCGGYTFFTKAYRPSRADMDTWLECAKYRDERTRDADIRVAQQLEQFDSQGVGNG